MNKFTKYEEELITKALDEYTIKLEDDVIKKNEETNDRYLFAPGFFTMVVRDIKMKINNYTKKS